MLKVCDRLHWTRSTLRPSRRGKHTRPLMRPPRMCITSYLRFTNFQCLFRFTNFQIGYSNLRILKLFLPINEFSNSGHQFQVGSAQFSSLEGGGSPPAQLALAARQPVGCPKCIVGSNPLPPVQTPCKFGQDRKKLKNGCFPRWPPNFFPPEMVC